MANNVIKLPSLSHQAWRQIEPHVYKLAFDRSGSKEIAEMVSKVVEEKYHLCVPVKFSVTGDISDQVREQFFEHMHKIVGSYTAELATVYTDGFILKLADGGHHE